MERPRWSAHPLEPGLHADVLTALAHEEAGRGHVDDVRAEVAQSTEGFEAKVERELHLRAMAGCLLEMGAALHVLFTAGATASRHARLRKALKQKSRVSCTCL